MQGCNTNTSMCLYHQLKTLCAVETCNLKKEKEKEKISDIERRLVVLSVMEKLCAGIGNVG